MDCRLFFLLLLIPCSEASGDIQYQEELNIKEMTCPTWYNTNSAGQCECGVRLKNSVMCKPNKKVAIGAWLCMSYDNKSKVTVAGNCIYSPLDSSNDYFIEQPIGMTELDNFTCSWLKRTGLLCSHCKNRSHGVAVLSYRYGRLQKKRCTVMPKVDREKSGPPGPLLAEKNGPGGPLFSAKSGPALPKVDLVHFVKKKVDPVQFWQGKKVDLVQFRRQNLNRSVFGRGKKWTRSSFAVKF